MNDASSEANLQRRDVVLACVATLVLLAAGIFANAVAVKRALKFGSLFFEQFNAMEMPAIALIAAFTLGILAILIWNRRQGERLEILPADERRIAPPGWALPALLTVVGAVIVAGFFVAFHRYYIADDEYSAWFQARIFARGATSVRVPPQWCEFARAITPTTIASPRPCTWQLAFLPGHSLVRAAFLALRADWLAGAVVAAISLLLVFSIARKLWPSRPERAWLSVAILAASTQLLFMSMTMFSMSTHLLFALIWLWLYVDDRHWSIALLPVASFCELGAHSSAPHLCWVAPFILRYALQRRWLEFSYTALGLVIAILLWTRYGTLAANPAAAAATVSVVSSASTAAQGYLSVLAKLQWDPFVTAMNLALVATWNSPIVIVALILGMLAWAKQDGFVRTCIVSLVLTVALRAITWSLQGEGFGYRFIYDNLGEIALICVGGIEVLGSAIGMIATKRLLLVSAAATVLIQLPMRFLQVDALATPWARTYAWLTSQPAKVVVFNPGDVMWGRQLLRNDPFFEQGPVLVSAPELPKGGLEKLRAMYPGQVRVVSKAELMQFGLERQPMMFGSLRISE